MDVTERKRAEKQMQQAVQHDSLTGLPNRALLFDYCGHILAMSARSEETVAIVFIDLGTLRLNVSSSIGISLFPQHATNLELLIRCADMAMYAAKKVGRNNFRIYATGLIDNANGLLRLEGLLKHALESNSLALFYQPILDTQSRELIGVEVLIRVPAEDGILLGPAEFIPVAETTGLMNRIGDWVVRQACLQHRDWCDTGLPPVTIAINVSPMQFRQPGFVSVLADAIKEFEVEPAFLQIEVTESTIMDDVPDTVETLNRLQAMGIRIALDDFGTGYSSLSHLSNLPLNKLKIDQSFIRKMMDSPSSQSITEAIIALGRTLNLKVVGEGIESEEAMEFLRDHRCDQVQGFLFSRPLPPDEFVSWCRTRSLH